MPANTSPVYGLSGVIGSVLVTAANTSSQGGGTIATDIFLVKTLGSNGSFLRGVIWLPTATTPTTTTGTVGRVFLSTQSSSTTTSSNTWLLGEITLPAIAADNASTGVPPLIVPLGFSVPTGYSILVTNHAAPAANTAWRANLIGSDF